MTNRRVLMIALDSLEPATFATLLRAGGLPNLEAFTSRVSPFDVVSDGDLLHGSIWPTFASGTNPGYHGVHYWTQWLAEEQREVRNDHAAFSYEPFWSVFPLAGRRAVVVDVPYVPVVEGPGMRSLQRWGLHDEMLAVSSPQSFRSEIVNRFGKHPLGLDTLEPQSPGDKLEMVAEMQEGVGMRSRLIEAIAGERDWDLFITTFGELHKAGHYLAGPQQLDADTSNIDAIGAVLAPLDAAWPAIEAAAGSDTEIVLFGLHGMTHQVAYSGFGPQLLQLVLGQEPVDDGAHPDLLRRLRDLGPDAIHREIWKRLPPRLRAARQARLSAADVDTSTSALFPVTHDGAAGVRVNLMGRERDGFVSAAERAQFLDSLEHLALALVADDGKKAFTRLLRQEEMPGPRSHRLPDALIVPNPEVTGTHGLRRPDGQLLVSSQPEARNGVHTAKGFCYVRTAGSAESLGGVLMVRDFAPTVLGRLGLPIPSQMEGRPFLR